MSDFNPDWYSPTGDTIKTVLQEKGISKEEFAQSIGRTFEYTEGILEGTEAINSEMAEILARVLGSTAGFWLRRDLRYWKDKARCQK